MSRRKGRAPRPPLLSARAVTKVHGAARALGPVSFDVTAGELVALVGHNGSGKSTLLAAAAGLLDPTEGTVTINGVAAGETPARAAVSYVPDHPVLYDDLTVNEHLEYLSRLHGSTPAAQGSDEVLSALGLTQRADELPANFSRGLRQKTAIAVALCRPFALLLVDEPFAGLDVSGRSAFLEILSGLRADNGAAIVATHDLATLETFDRAIQLDQGELTYDGPPSGLPTAGPSMLRA